MLGSGNTGWPQQHRPDDLQAPDGVLGCLVTVPPRERRVSFGREIWEARWSLDYSICQDDSIFNGLVSPDDAQI